MPHTILYASNETRSGSWYYRIYLPRKYLKERGFLIDTFESELPGFPYDSVIFFRLFKDFNPIKEYIDKERGKKLIGYDTDDLLINLERSNPASFELSKHAHTQKLIARYADFITVSTENLAQEMRNITEKPIYVLPNLIDSDGFAAKANDNKEIKICYAGGGSHYVELSDIVDILSDLNYYMKQQGMREIPYKLIIFGFASERDFTEVLLRGVRLPGKYPEIKYACQNLLNKLPKMNYEYIPFVDVLQYQKTLDEIKPDIGICYLKDSRFNRSKSSIKYYEYVHAGAVALSSDMPVYNHLPGPVAHKNRITEWTKLLYELMNSAGTRHDFWQKQAEYVLQNATWQSKGNIWADTYDKILCKNYTI